MSSSTRHPSNKTGVVFMWHMSHCFTHPPHTSPLLPSSPPSPSLLSLCNSLHTVQGAHGLDGRPGPVVSGARPVPSSTPLFPSIPLRFPPPASLFFLSVCLCLSCCLLASVFCVFSVLSNGQGLV